MNSHRKAFTLALLAALRLAGSTAVAQQPGFLDKDEWEKLATNDIVEMTETNTAWAAPK